jgi:hypothetical protein
VERVVMGAVDEDKALWLRVQALLRAVWRWTEPAPWLCPTLALWADKDHKDIIDRYTEIIGDGLEPLILARVRNSELSVAYYMVERPSVGTVLTPPYKVIAALKNPTTGVMMHLAVQETEHFVAQFGPYDWSEILKRG